MQGINRHHQQLEVRDFIDANKLSLFGLVETRVRRPKFEFVAKEVFHNWDVIHNFNFHDNWRIWIGWDSSKLDVSMLEETDQVIHAKIRLVELDKEFFTSIIYVANDEVFRQLL